MLLCDVLVVGEDCGIIRVCEAKNTFYIIAERACCS